MRLDVLNFRFISFVFNLDFRLVPCLPVILLGYFIFSFKHFSWGFAIKGKSYIVETEI